MITGKIKSKYIVNDIRFNSGYFLNEDAVNSRSLEENRDKCTPLDAIATVWNPPIFKRQFCQKTERAIPYCQSSDVTNALEGSDVYINKIQATKVGSVVEENQILVTGFGTIGNTRLINELSSGISYANNCCRIQANEDKLFGYIYAVMTSKYGRSQLNKNASGSVVRYIEAPGIKKTLIPNLPEAKQQEIHNLIIEASNLRVEANKLLKDAEVKFHSLNEITYPDSWTSMSENAIQTGFKVNKSDFFKTTIKARNHSLRATKIISYWSSKKGFVLNSMVSEEGLTRGMGGFFKRITDKNIKGMDIISQGDIHDKSPTFKQVIKKDIKESEVARKGMIILPAAGTLGENEIFVKPQLIYKNFEGKVLSEVVGKIRPVEIENAAYIYVALKSIGGFRILRAMVYGTNLMYPNWELLKNLNIPCKNEQVMNIIANLVIDSYDKIALANNAENQAIDLVEKEIESW